MIYHSENESTPNRHLHQMQLHVCSAKLRNWTLHLYSCSNTPIRIGFPMHRTCNINCNCTIKCFSDLPDSRLVKPILGNERVEDDLKHQCVTTCMMLPAMRISCRSRCSPDNFQVSIIASWWSASPYEQLYNCTRRNPLRQECTITNATNTNMSIAQ